MVYVATLSEGRLDAARMRTIAMARSAWDGPVFYVAGPPGLVTATEGLLRNLGIATEQVRSDRFDGY